MTPRQENRQRRRERDLEGYRALRRAERQRRRRRHREMVFGHYGRRCACCAAAERLTIDHVDGDGAEHRREMGSQGSWALYRWLVVNGFPPGFQTLCEPCNGSKGRRAACRIDHEREADAA